MSTNASSQQTTTQLETTLRVYCEYYTEKPNYDFYPGLARKLSNGYVHRPNVRVPEKRQQTDFISMRNTPSRYANNADENQFWRPAPPAQQETPSWDLYPAVLRNVENNGTDQMRQRLHTMEATITTP